MTGYNDTMQVCLKNGHRMTDHYESFPQGRKSFCDMCGSKTTTTCPDCGGKIRGGYNHTDVLVLGGKSPDVQLHCLECGASYPWKNRLKMSNAMKSIANWTKEFLEPLAKLIKGTK